MLFSLHPQLSADCTSLGELALCRILLMDDARFPWVILVPMREGVREVFDLSGPDQVLLMEEISFAARALQQLTQANKMNIAMLGNQVPQLHAHVIARFQADAAWPNPVWSSATPRERYSDAAKSALAASLRQALNITHL